MFLKRFIDPLKTAGILSGFLLMSATCFAILLNNSPLEPLYHALIAPPVLFVINDVLMTIFFFTVGLEIKREFYLGVLKERKTALLPLLAAVGGMLVPVLFYVLLNYHNKASLQGWAIPTATDIAFSLGVLALLGKRVPTALRIFLLALAVIDDIGAILIIAVYYTTHLSTLYILGTMGCIFLLFILNRLNVRALGIYLMIGFFLWWMVLQSGVHPTIGGILLAFMIPLDNGTHAEPSPLLKLEHRLIPWVNNGILPLFAFANVGLSFKTLHMTSLLNPLPLGIALGLFLGKPLGIFFTSYFCTRCQITSLPEGVSWKALYGVSMLCGIGFTVSLFIGNLSFSAHMPEGLNLVRLGVLVGSVLSGIAGYCVLSLCLPKKQA